MGRAQDMLTDAGSSQTNIRSVILNSMEPHLSAPERPVVDGPRIELDEQQVLGRSLATHELTTNAGKYGALSVPEGRVEVRWTLGADHAFDLTWRESGGPAPEATGATGFGSTILDRATGGYFGGRFALRLKPGGTVFTSQGRMSASDS